MSKVGNANRYARVRAEREARRDRAVAKLLASGCAYIPDHPNYLVSAAGDVYSTYKRRVIKLRQGVKPGGYAFVGLRGKRLAYKMVHRLVAQAFIPNRDGLPEVNHKNGRKLDNKVDNLEWSTRSRNAMHAFDNGLMKRGSTSPFCKLRPSQVRKVRNAGGRYRDIGAKYGVSAQTVCNVKRRSRYADVT